MKCALLIMYNNIIKPMLNNPDASDKWMENEEIEFEELPTQRAMKKRSTSQSVSCYVRLITSYAMLYYFSPIEPAIMIFEYIQTIENYPKSSFLVHLREGISKIQRKTNNE